MEKQKVIVFEWKCQEEGCNKEITSINKDQFDYNKEQHILSHKRKGDKQ